jgi:O-antigen/teichoic acid export membrane protein
MRRDIASAYLAIAARIGGMLVVSAVVYRKLGFEAFAIFNLIRSTVGLLNYVGLGLAPAMVRMLAEARGRPEAPSTEIPRTLPATGTPVLAYAGPSPEDAATSRTARVYASGEILAAILGFVGFQLAVVHSVWAVTLYRIDVRPGLEEPTQGLAFALGLALVLRLVSEPPSSLLQVGGRIALDNVLVTASEALAAALAVLAVYQGEGLMVLGGCYVIGAGALLAMRWVAAAWTTPGMVGRAIRAKWFAPDLRPTHKALLLFGTMVTLGQLADFLYSPVDYILITRLLRLEHVGIYAPAVQIDSGLLTLVTGLSAVLLPKAALAHAAGDPHTVRRYYFRGTLASVALLLVAALAVWALSPWIFRLWLGRDMPETRAILPLVLIHTVVGGSSAVGRSILLGMGKVKPFTVSVLTAGIGNVVLSYVFVSYFGWGLTGIILGTIVAVVARAGIWMPWYVLRTLRETAAPVTSAASDPSYPTNG